LRLTTGLAEYLTQSPRFRLVTNNGSGPVGFDQTDTSR
jgi:hypothetical protein